MRILFWLSIGFDRRTPSEHLLTAMIEALIGQGHSVHILQKDSGGDKAALPDKIESLGVTTTRIKSIPPKKRNLPARFMADVLYIIKCIKYLYKNRSFDRVFMQSSNVAGVQAAVLRLLFKNVPVVFNVQDIFPENAVYCHSLMKNGIPYKIFSFMQRYAYKMADRIITISEDMKEQLTEVGVLADKIEVIYNWSYRDTQYDRDLLDTEDIRNLFGKDKFNVVYAGNIGMVQNVELVIKTAAFMKDCGDISFHIFGDGLYKEKLIRLKEELKADNITFHPMLDASLAPALYASADINVIPLAENIYRTALPSKVATCIASGTPIALCIGKKSVFGKKLSKTDGITLLDPDDEKGLADVIYAEMEKRNTVRCEELFSKEFSKTGNSNRYAEIIINSGK